MPRRSPPWRILAVAGLGVVIASRLAPGQADSPNAGEWLQRLGSEDVQVRRAAAAAIRDSDRKVKRAALPAFVSLLGGEKDGQVRLAVLDALTSLGPDAAPAVPALLATLRTDYGGQGREESHQDYRAALALAAIGKPAVEGLRGLLGERKASVKAEAAMALGRIGPDAAPAVPDLLLRLGEDEDRVAAEAARALGRIGAPAVEPLLAAAADPRAGFRARVVEALGPLAGDDRVSEAILERARDASAEVRAAALGSLARSGLPAGVLLPVVESGLADEEESVHRAVANLVMGRREWLLAVVPRLRALLLAEDEAVSRQAAFLLRATGPEAAPMLLAALPDGRSPIEAIASELAQLGRPVAEPLTHALGDPEPRVRQGAALALAQMRPLPPGLVERLTAGLEDPNPKVRAAFLNAVGHLDRRGAAALPGVRAMLDDESSEIRRRAIEVLLVIAPRDGALLADLATGLDDADPLVTERAIEAIGSLGPVGRAALPAVIVQLDNPDLRVRRAAAEVVTSHGSAAASAVPALSRMLDHESAEVRTIAVRTLGSLGSAAQPALSRLTVLLSDQPVEVRTAVLLTLGSLELDAETIRAPLSEALLSDVPEIRGAALRAIQRLGPAGAIFVPDLILLAADRAERRGIERSLRRYERTGPDPRSIPSLIEELDHEEEAVRRLAVKFLGLAGPKAMDALPALERLQVDPSTEVRQEAEAARARIEGKPGQDRRPDGTPGSPGRITSGAGA